MHKHSSKSTTVREASQDLFCKQHKEAKISKFNRKQQHVINPYWMVTITKCSRLNRLKMTFTKKIVIICILDRILWFAGCNWTAVLQIWKIWQDEVLSYIITGVGESLQGQENIKLVVFEVQRWSTLLQDVRRMLIGQVQKVSFIYTCQWWEQKNCDPDDNQLKALKQWVYEVLRRKTRNLMKMGGGEERVVGTEGAGEQSKACRLMIREAAKAQWRERRKCNRRTSQVLTGIDTAAGVTCITDFVIKPPCCPGGWSSFVFSSAPSIQVSHNIRQVR